MPLSVLKRIKRYSTLSILFFLLTVFPAAASEQGGGNVSNALGFAMVGLMLLLLFAIVVLARVVLVVGKMRLKQIKEKQSGEVAKTIVSTLLLMFAGHTLFAQEQASAGAAMVGMSATLFYTIVSVIVLEIAVIIILLLSVKMLLKGAEEDETEKAAVKKPAISWWTKINRFKPVEQEADIDLGHDYDGIRELDNRLPPWWLYGFYVSIFFAAIYLWRYHVAHSAPLSAQEYETSVAEAEIKIKEYLAKKGESVDENTVTFLSSPEDLAAGKTIFNNSCANCHKETGAGDVGPNLTDDYWLHGGDMKSIFKTIRYGINAMPQWQTAYSNKQIAQVASFVKSLRGSNPADAKEPQGNLFTEEAPTAEATAEGATDSTAAVVNN